MNQTVLPNRVACSCSPTFHHPILFDLSPEGPVACLRCGRVSFSQVNGDDGRGGGEAWMEIISMEVAEPVAVWIAQFPRKVNGQYFSSKERFGSLRELERAVEKNKAETGGLSLAERIKAAGIPAGAPPQGLPGWAGRFASVWHTLHLDAQSSIEKIAEYAMRSPFELALLEPLLLHRADIDELICGWLTEEPIGLYWYTKNAGEPFFLATDLLLRQKTVGEKPKQILLNYLRTVPVQKNPYWHDELKHAFRIDAALRVVETFPPAPEILILLSDLKKRIGDPAVKSYAQVTAALQKIKAAT